MKYRDLIQFEAVTEVIQLVTANKKETATLLVDSYVISDRMADVIMHHISPALKLGDQSLREDPKLKFYYDNALNHAARQPRQEHLI